MNLAPLEMSIRASDGLTLKGVLTYPATRGGYEVHKKSFIALIKTFKLLREGPR